MCYMYIYLYSRFFNYCCPRGASLWRIACRRLSLLGHLEAEKKTREETHEIV